MLVYHVATININIGICELSEFNVCWFVTGLVFIGC